MKITNGKPTFTTAEKRHNIGQAEHLARLERASLVFLRDVVRRELARPDGAEEVELTHIELTHTMLRVLDHALVMKDYGVA